METSRRDNNNGGAVASSPSPPLQKPAKFAVYQNPALSAALTSTNLLIKLAKIVMGLTFIGASAALAKAIAFSTAKVGAGVVVTSSSNGTKVETCLSGHQLRLLGVKKLDTAVPEQSKKPPVSKPRAALDPLIPLHQSSFSSSRLSRVGSEKSSSTALKSKIFVVPSKQSNSPTHAVSPSSPQLSSAKTSTGLDQLVSTPWSNKRASPAREILTEDELEHFLADVDKKITESAEKLATPPPTRSGFSISSPSTISGSANTSGTTRTTPLRPVRMSPSSQKFNTPPKKGEADIPTPLSMEEMTEAFEHLGIYPQIEGWRDHLRQWFSSVLLTPLLSKIENSHNKVMQAAAKLGISITVTSVGSDSSGAEAPRMSPLDRAKEWQPAFSTDEDGLLHQLRAYLVQALDSSTQNVGTANQLQIPQQNAFLPTIQECVDAITEHQRLLALTKGELIKGLLPQSSVPAEYTVRRIKELAEGTCLRNYEYMRKEEASDKAKKWTIELPSDSHLLLYLFCAFLEYPKWMLHVDPSSYSGALSSKNPLFLGVLPPKERFPEKYVAVLSVVPSILHPGSCVLVIGRQCPPVFVMYWDKKLQFCLQGRTALWDSILLLCHRIKVAYGGLVRGVHLGSTALNILPLLESEDDD
uniref:Transmembrane protein 209 n=1 Tax=Chenopodium quinoa TaxID=63459 RepID=A0A803M7Y3_CHEQI